MKNRRLFFLSMFVFGLSSPALADKPAKNAKPAPRAAPATTVVSRRTAIPAAEAISAAQLGDVPAMNRLKGSKINLRGKHLRTYRETKAYRDFLILTGPDFKLAGAESGVEVLIRVPTTLNPDKLPELIDATGTLSDYESRPDGNSLHWMPVITVNVLK